MKIRLILSATRRRAVTPEANNDSALVTGACPSCSITPFRIAGKGKHVASHDTYESEGYCLACGANVGTIRAKVDTIFGIEEDQRVLNSRCRVY